MPFKPDNNLPPGSQPWAREIVGAVDSAQFQANRANLNNKNAFKTINATLDQLAEQQAELAQQQEYLAGLKTVADEVGGFDFVAATVNGAWTWVGSSASVTLNVPTGRVLVTVHCSFMDAIVNPFASMWYGVGYSLSASPLTAAYSYSFGFGDSSGASTEYGSNISLVDVKTVTPGEHTFTASRAYYGSSLASGAMLKANSLRLIVQVIENN